MPIADRHSEPVRLVVPGFAVSQSASRRRAAAAAALSRYGRSVPPADVIGLDSQSADRLRGSANLVGFVLLIVLVAVLPAPIAREQARTCDTIYVADLTGLRAQMVTTMDVATGHVLSSHSRDGAAVHATTICGLHV